MCQAFGIDYMHCKNIYANSLYVCLIINAATINVSMSETGMEQSTPLSPKYIGSNIANPTPKTISRIIDSVVDAAALPIACRKINLC